MRTIPLLCALAAVLPATSPARACDPVVTGCQRAVVVFPAFTPEGMRVGAVEAEVRQPYPLEVSRFTGLPRDVLYNNPRSLPGSIDPGLRLVPLPRVPRFSTQAAFPRGY